MRIEAFVDSVKSDEFDFIKEKSLKEIIKYINENKLERYYVTLNKKPVFVFTPVEIIDIFLQNKLDKTFEAYFLSLENYKLETIEANKHIIDTYNYLRSKRLQFACVVKNEELIGEIVFSTLSLKISFIAIKDPLTNTYNQQYFDILVEEYNEISQALGIIMIKIYDISIFESLYGYDFKNKILKTFAYVIKNSVRDIDFVFRNEDVFKILTFNNAEITMKIKHRIEDRLKDLKIDDITIPCKVVATNIPELESNIFLAVEGLEEKLIERD
jgi:diguanylate cyclase (GGDEF)-like protein